jgi:hypothetical protein
VFIFFLLLLLLSVLLAGHLQLSESAEVRESLMRQKGKNK